MKRMNAGKVFMVTERTLQTHLKYGFVATGIIRKRDESGVFLGSNWVKTIWDLLADILSLRRNDKVFFWIYGQSTGESLVGTWKIDEDYPFFHSKTIEEVNGANFPFRNKIRPSNMWTVKIPSDYLFSSQSHYSYLWSLSSKKTLGAFGSRGKSLITLPPDGAERLQIILKEFEKEISSGSLYDFNEVRIDPPKNVSYPIDKDIFKLGIEEMKEMISNNPRMDEVGNTKPASPGEIDLSKIPIRGRIDRQKEKEFCVEKALEAWLVTSLARDNQINEVLGVDEILWFSNYVPCTVSGVNADLVIIGRKNKGLKVFLVELKKSKLSGKSFTDSLIELRRYFVIFKGLLDKPLKETWGVDDIDFIPVIIAHKFGNSIPKYLLKFKNLLTTPKFIEYNITDEWVELREKKLLQISRLF